MPEKKDVGSATGAELIAAVDPGNVIPMARPHEAALDEHAPAVGALLDEALALMRARASGDARPIPLPWPDLSTALGGGLWPGLHVLTGATGTGKSQWALQVALKAAKQGTPTLYVALELGAVDLVARLLALELAEENVRTAPRWSDLYLGKRPEELERAAGQAAAVLHGLPLRLEVGPPHGWSADQLGARVAALRTMYPEDRDRPGSRPLLVVIDYLQAMAAPAGEGRRMDLRERIGVAAYQARAAARDFGAAVLMLSSVSRANASNLGQAEGSPEGERTPEAAAGLVGMGKESGEIEYAADSVLAMVRTERAEGVALAVAKVRAGRPTWVDLRFNGGWFEQGREDFIPLAKKGGAA
jgi:replicative DNA helicase